MIRLSGSANIRVYLSETVTLPNTFSGFTGNYTHTESHTLGAIPDRVDVICPGDTTEEAAWYYAFGPHGQAPNCDHGWNSFAQELAYPGASCFSKSPTQFKVIFQRLWSGRKVYFKAYIFDGVNRSN